MKYRLRSRRSVLLFAFVILLFIFVEHLVIYPVFTKYNGYIKHAKVFDHNDIEQSITRDKQIILVNESNSVTTFLLWTPYFKIDSWGIKGPKIKPVNDADLDSNLCSKGLCEVTTNRSKMDTASVVLFHCRNNITDKEMLMKNRRPDQIFIVYCMESPSHSNFTNVDTVGMNGTMTYRYDSDFPTLYGTLGPKKEQIFNYKLRTPLMLRNKSVVGMMSNCHPSSQRDRLVMELSKHIDVHTYGKCGKQKCLNGTFVCLNTFAKEYKFYMSFENSLCKDYVTEKFWWALKNELIPVVFGGANYTNIAPEGGFIDATTFSSPKHLAEYLHKLGRNQTEYEQYFKWKKTHEFKPLPLSQALCRICAITKSGGFRQEARSYQSWWESDACHNEFMDQWQKH